MIEKSFVRKLGVGIALAGVIAVGCGGSVEPGPSCPAMTPTVRVVGPIDKVDLLFSIDNSASMAEKQAFLAQAIPALVGRLMAPDCVNQQDQRLREPSNAGKCSNGYRLEFAPVNDLHLGVVTTSLGGGGSPDVCDGTGPAPIGVVRHDDDKAHLVTRTKPNGGPEGAVKNAQPIDGNGGGFLAWLPASDPANQGKPLPNVPVEPSVGDVLTDFQSLVTGAQEYGCGLEAPLESWYRFLVQPDPWASIPKSSGGSGAVTLDGVDAVLLKQRKDFLREDSLVGVIMLTDEEDSWTDPLTLQGRGWITRTQNFPSTQAKQPGTMPRATSECAKDPNDPACTSCGFQGNKPNTVVPIASDPQCQKACGASCVGFYTSAEDNLNVRYTNDMKRKYGFDPQFPIQRYVDGLQSTRVPDREGEHTGGGGPYLGKKNCANPLFARDLPDGSSVSASDLCNLKPGARTPDLVFFGVIGGVPWQLLSEDSKDPAAAMKASLGPSDWTSILGKDPANYVYDGIDPHMIESITPRQGLPTTTAPSNADPVHGREWKTTLSATGLDLQYACTFALQAPKDCTLPGNASTCDCAGAAGGPEGSPICNGTTQLRGKAYPTIRQLRVAQALGGRAAVASLCAPNLVDRTKRNFGLAPIADGLVAILNPVLSGRCVDRTETRDASGAIPCRLIEEQPAGVTTCDASRGLAPASKFESDCYLGTRVAELKVDDPNASAKDVGTLCELAQIPATKYQSGTCAKDPSAGWCWVLSSEAGGTCPSTLVLTDKALPAAGARVTLQCDK